MDRTYRFGYLLVLVLALALPGARWFFWPTSRPQVVDAAMAQAGEVLFKHDWKQNDPLCPEGDGLGPLFNATSCVACHNQGGLGGGGGLAHNVTMFTVRPNDKPPREGVVHAHHVKGAAHQETLHNVHPELPTVSQPNLNQLVVLDQGGRGSSQAMAFPAGVHISQRNTPALFGAKLIDEIPERDILAGAKSQRLKWAMASANDKTVPVGRALPVGNGRIGRFGWKAQMASLSDFVRAACANELGLGNQGNSQPTPIYAVAITAVQTPALDLTPEQCNQLTAFCASLSRPVERLPKGVSAGQAAAGRNLFGTIGCADCHTPKLGTVEGLYSDLLLHEMGHDLVGGGSYGDTRVPVPNSSGDGISPSEWRTPPLWGVADSAPYLHDGRATTLESAIQLHGGQATRSARAFAMLSPDRQTEVIAFLKTLRAP
jgi:CxxC motif-containing protein (DUF1111 family)